ncbi:hypothetical protein Tco_0640576 [Tanacetum coccineum]
MCFGGKLWEASKRRRSLLLTTRFITSKGSSEGSGIISEVPDEPKDNSEVVEKQAGNVQTSLTLSSAKLEIQSMVDVPIHQELHSLTLLSQWLLIRHPSKPTPLIHTRSSFNVFEPLLLERPFQENIECFMSGREHQTLVIVWNLGKHEGVEEWK